MAEKMKREGLPGKDKKMQDLWVKPRHVIARNIAYMILAPYSRIRYGITVKKCEELNNRQCLVLMNHQTAFDQFFLGIAFSQPVYYLASEDIFSNGWISSLIRWLVAPIPIKKQAMDIGAIRNCVRVVMEGGTIAIAPEGNRTYSGKTEYMSPAISVLAKKLKLPIALYRIEGGYGVHPRWSDVIRKGSMRSYVSKIIEPEEYEGLSNDELYSLIKDGLYVDDTEADSMYVHKKRAEYLERAVYVCPFCGLSNFHSRNEMIECTRCHHQIEYGENLELKGKGFEFPFRFFTEWYEYQKKYVSELDLSLYIEEPMYRETANLYEVILNKCKKLLQKDANIALYGNRIVLGAQEIDFDACHAVSVLGKNKLNIYYDGKVYQLKGSKRFNALKYVNMYYCHKNIPKEDVDGKFLGL